MPRLDEIFTGFELGRLEQGFSKTYGMLQRRFPTLLHSIADIVEPVIEFYRRRPPDIQAQLSPGDLAFLEAYIAAIQPNTVIEVGVASGFSSAFILSSMSRWSTGPTHKVISFETSDVVFWNDQLATGFVVEQLPDAQRVNWDFRLGKTLLDLQEDLGNIKGSILALVDGEHCHPCPLIDVLVLINALPPESWILLQDIRLSERLIGDALRLNSDPMPGLMGPGLVYDYWSGEKVRGMDATFNMCAVQIPENTAHLRGNLFKTLAYPAEIDLSGEEEAFLERQVKKCDLSSKY